MWADGQIVDLSMSGANLMVPAIHPLPEVPNFCRSAAAGYDVRLKWRRGDLAGLAIEGRREIEGSKDQDLVDLRRLGAPWPRCPSWRAFRFRDTLDLAPTTLGPVQ